MAKSKLHRNFDKELDEVAKACPNLFAESSAILVICQPTRTMVPVNSDLLGQFKGQFRYWQRHLERAMRQYMKDKKE